MSVKKKKVSLHRGQLPTKQRLNFAANGKKSLNLKVLIPVLVIIVAAAVVLMKYAVIDRLVAMTNAQEEVAAMQTEAQALDMTIASLGDMTDAYAHYTVSGLTSDEIGTVEFTKVLDLVQNRIMKEVTVGQWAFRENQLTMPVRADSLKTINNLIAELQGEEIVEFCTVSNAAGERDEALDDEVTAEITIYLTALPGEEDV